MVTKLQENKKKSAGVMETRKKLKRSYYRGNYLMLYSKVNQTQFATRDVALLIDKSLEEKVRDYKLVNNRRLEWHK